jgi:hypothetical protein
MEVLEYLLESGKAKRARPAASAAVQLSSSDAPEGREIIEGRAPAILEVTP